MMTRTKSKNRMIYLPITVGILIGAVSIPNFIQAQGGTYNVTGIDNNSETLYEANFVKSNDLSGDPINRIYAKKYTNGMTTFMGSKLILKKAGNETPTNTTKNTSPILGGENNTNNSENITIIGGSDANIEENNDNATILGAQKGIISQGNSESTPAVLIGGNQNTIGKGQDANVILGGGSNKIREDSKNVTILGGKNNEIQSENTIIAGNNIEASNNTTNSFVFSNSEGSDKFTPESKNSFYLNIKKGLGINKVAEGEGGVESNGAINMGTIDITTECTSDNIGLMGYFQSCLVGCTTGSALSGNKWNLMDAHTGCIELCNENSGHCITTTPIEYDSRTGKCYGDSGIVNHNTEYCKSYNTYLNQNFNVNFKRERVDECPSTISDSSNPCLYTCIDDATIVEGICRKNCHLTNVGKDVVFHHGESITGYTNTTQTCTSQCNQTEARLTCDDGNWKLANGNKDTRYKYITCTTLATSGTCDGSFTLTKEEMNAHLTGNKYTTCTGYSVSNQKCESYNYYKHTQNCDAGRTYNEALGYCTKDCSWNGKNDYKLGQTVTGWNATSIDCTSSSSRCESHTLTCNEDGSWGTEHSSYPYTSCTLKGKTCDLYTLSSCPDHGHCGECFTYTANSPYQCLSGQNKFQLLRCDTGYTLTNNTCQPDCNLPWGDKLAYGQSITAFQKTGTTCPEACPSTTLTCGTNGQLNGGNASLYNQKECIITDKKCDARFNLTTNTTPGGIFDTCVGYTTDQTSCTSFTTYDLTGCQWPYLYTGDTCKAACEPLIGQTENLIQQGGIKKVQHGTTIDAYKANSQTCTNLCSNIHTKVYCDNGTWKYSDSGITANVGAGGYRYATCQDNNKVCTSYNSNGIKTFIRATDPKITNATLTKPNSSTESHCTPYNYNSAYNRCDIQNTYFYYKCNSTYAWNPAGTACTRCQQSEDNANLPTNAERNNSTQPMSITTWTYNPNSTAACTYKCNSTSKRDGEKCASDCTHFNNIKITKSDGTNYKNGDTMTVYKKSSPICPEACKSIELTCINGTRSGDSTSTYTERSCTTTGNMLPEEWKHTSGIYRTFTGNHTPKFASEIKVSPFPFIEQLTDGTQSCKVGDTWKKWQCLSGHTRGNDGDCHKNCTGTARTDSGMPSGTIKHGTTKTGYKSPTTCNSSTSGSSCDSTTLICSDGNLLIKSSGASGSAYNHAACVLQGSNPNSCSNTDGWTTTKPDSSIYTYTGCTEYPSQTDPLKCTTLNHYKITGCKSSSQILVNGSCVNICNEPSSSCNGDYSATANQGNYYSTYLCKKTGASSVSCNCPPDQVWDNSMKICRDKSEFELCASTHFNCLLGATVSNTHTGTNQWTWDCSIGDIGPKSCSEDRPEPPTERKVCQYVEESKVYYEIEDGKSATIELPIGSLTYDYHDNCSSNNIPDSCLLSTRKTQDFSISKGNSTSNIFQYDRHITIPGNLENPAFTNGRPQIIDETNNIKYTISDCSPNLCTLVTQPGGMFISRSELDNIITINSTDEYGVGVRPTVTCYCDGINCTNDKEKKCKVLLNQTSVNNNKYRNLRIISNENAGDPYKLEISIANGCDQISLEVENCPTGTTYYEGRGCVADNCKGTVNVVIHGNAICADSSVSLDLDNEGYISSYLGGSEELYTNNGKNCYQFDVAREAENIPCGKYNYAKLQYGVDNIPTTLYYQGDEFTVSQSSTPMLYFNNGTTPTYNNCSFNGSSYSHGNTVFAYNTSSVACGSSCPAKTTFYCNNGSRRQGSLNGSTGTPYSSCSVAACPSCAASKIPCGNASLAHGSSRTCYNSPATCPSDCSSITYTCNNGSVDKTYNSSYSSTSCTLKASSDYYLYNGKCEPKPACNSNGGCSEGSATADEGNYYSTYLCKKTGASDVSCNCPTNQVWDNSMKICRDKSEFKLCASTHFNCLLGATVSNTHTGDNQWTWNCTIGDIGPKSCSEEREPDLPCITPSCGTSFGVCAKGTVQNKNATSRTRQCKGGTSADPCSVTCKETYTCSDGGELSGSQCIYGPTKYCLDCYTISELPGQGWLSDFCNDYGDKINDVNNRCISYQGAEQCFGKSFTPKGTLALQFDPVYYNMLAGSAESNGRVGQYCEVTRYEEYFDVNASIRPVLDDDNDVININTNGYLTNIGSNCEFRKGTNAQYDNGYYLYCNGKIQGGGTVSADIKIKEIGSCSCPTPVCSTTAGECLIGDGSTPNISPCTGEPSDGTYERAEWTCTAGGSSVLCTKGTCFIAGTQVKMADGTTKPIENVKVGDQLLGNEGINTVEELYRPLLNQQTLRSINGSKAFVSESHPFMTTEGWKSRNPEVSMQLMDEEVTLLEEGDILITENGYEEIKSLIGMCAPADTQLYNFKVSGDHTYYANGYLVHNKRACPGRKLITENQ